MRKIITRIGILFFIICFFYQNNSSAAPMYYYPKKYNITINNINKEDVKKIEVFTPGGYFDDEEEKVEIDGRLFNYNNYYYRGTEGKEYNGIKCYIIDTVDKEDIGKNENGINILISNIDIPFNLRIYMNDGKEIYTDNISSSMIIDEFSYKDKEYVKEVKRFKKSIAYFIAEYDSNKPWIETKEMDEELIVIKSNNNLIVIITITVSVCGVSIIYVLTNKRSKRTK